VNEKFKKNSFGWLRAERVLVFASFFTIIPNPKSLMAFTEFFCISWRSTCWERRKFQICPLEFEKGLLGENQSYINYFLDGNLWRGKKINRSNTKRCIPAEREFF
jgi:hypothetical protein